MEEYENLYAMRTFLQICIENKTNHPTTMKYYQDMMMADALRKVIENDFKDSNIDVGNLILQNTLYKEYMIRSIKNKRPERALHRLNLLMDSHISTTLKFINEITEDESSEEEDGVEINQDMTFHHGCILIKNMHKVW